MGALQTGFWEMGYRDDSLEQLEFLRNQKIRINPPVNYVTEVWEDPPFLAKATINGHDP